jgi:hypothetical protein
VLTEAEGLAFRRLTICRSELPASTAMADPSTTRSDPVPSWMLLYTPPPTPVVELPLMVTSDNETELPELSRPPPSRYPVLSLAVTLFSFRLPLYVYTPVVKLTSFAF